MKIEDSQLKIEKNANIFRIHGHTMFLELRAMVHPDKNCVFRRLVTFMQEFGINSLSKIRYCVFWVEKYLFFCNKISVVGTKF